LFAKLKVFDVNQLVSAENLIDILFLPTLQIAIVDYFSQLTFN